jgi:PAS domain S-box-containing protein
MPSEAGATNLSLLEDLGACQRRFWKIQTEAFGGISLLDREGKVLFDGAGSEHLLGHTHGVDVGQSAFARVHPDDRARAQAFLTKALSCDGALAENILLRCLHVDGSYRWIEATLSNLLHDPAIKAIVCHWHEVTRWMEAEKELSQLGRFHQAVIETAAEGICVGQVIEEAPYLRFSIWNEQMTELTGLTLEEINRRGWLRSVLPEATERAFARFRDLVRGRQSRKEEWTIVRPDGVRRVVTVSSARLERSPGADEILFLCEDVTERRQAERDLAVEERRLRTALSAARMISWVLDIQSKTIHFSEDVAAYFGCQALAGPGPFATDQASLLIHPLHRELVESNYRKSLTADGEFTVEWQGAVPNPDGSPRWFATTGKLFVDAEGTLERSCGVTLEITERRRAEEERRALEQRVQEALRIDSLGVLAGGIAHEFNNLLTSILGFAGLAKAELPESNVPARGHLSQIELAAGRAAALCSQMLASAGRGRFLIELVDLSQLVRQSLVVLKAAVPKPLVLACELAPALPRVNVDAAQIRQAITNLVTNAAEALEGRSGIITLNTGTHELDDAYFAKCVECPGRAPGEYVCLEVSDNGPGIDPEISGRIFEPFFSTKFPGRGLGLAAVLGIVRGHQGALHFSSTPGKGCTFRISLPAAPLKGAQTPAAPAAVPTAALKIGEILVVDDEQRIRNLAIRLLRYEGYHAAEASDGLEAIKRVSDPESHVRLVLLDLTMPRLDGIQTARELRRRAPDLPIILMSGFSEQEVTAQASDFPFVRFLQKPFNRQQFLEAVHDSLAPIGP